jgi:nucleotide-binding universal stress UspA family protein
MTADLAASLEGPGVTVKGRALPLTGAAGDTITQASRIGADAVVQGSVSIDGRPSGSTWRSLIRSRADRSGNAATPPSRRTCHRYRE